MRYLSRAELEEKGIEFRKLNFQPMPQQEPATQPALATRSSVPGGVKPLTLAEARQGLAATFGVKPEAVEITIRG